MTFLPQWHLVNVLLVLTLLSMPAVDVSATVPPRFTTGGSSSSEKAAHPHAPQSSMDAAQHNRAHASRLFENAQSYLSQGHLDEARRAMAAAAGAEPTNQKYASALQDISRPFEGVVDLEYGGVAYQIMVFKGDEAETLTKIFFHKHKLVMEEEFYISVHNAINGVLRDETVETDLKAAERSKVVGDKLPRPTRRQLPPPMVQVQVTLCSQTISIEVDPAADCSISIERAMHSVQCQQPTSVERAEAMATVSESISKFWQNRATTLLRHAGPFTHDAQLFPEAEDSVLTEPLSGSATLMEEQVGLTWSWDDDARAAQEMLYRHQYPQDCSATGNGLFVYHHDKSYYGLAVDVHFLSVALNYCLMNDRVCVTRNPDHWNYAGRECAAGWECYFKPISSCVESDDWQPYTTEPRQDHTLDYKGYLYKIDTSSNRVLSYSNIDGPWQQIMHSDHYRRWLPDRFKHRGLLWWRSQLARYLFRPKQFVWEHILNRVHSSFASASSGAQMTSAMSLRDGPRIGLHVRHGDKSYDVVHQRSYFGGLRAYLEKAQGLVQRDRESGLTLKSGGVFVSTDDNDVLTEARNVGAQTGIQFHYDAEERRFNGTHTYAPAGVAISRWPGFPGNDDKVNTTLYALDSIKSVWMLATRDHFVGTATSCFSRLVYQLRHAMGHPDIGGAWSVDRDPRFDVEGWFVDP